MTPVSADGSAVRREAEARPTGGRALRWWTASGPLGIPRFVGLLLLIEMALALAYVVGAFVAGEGSVSNVVNLDGEANAATWFSSMQWFVISALVFAVADRRSTRADRRSWALWILAAAFLAFSADEVVKGHEYAGVVSDVILPVGSRSALVFSGQGVWVLTVGVPFLLLFGSLLILTRPYLRVPAGAFRKLVIGASLFLLGALVLEGVSNFIERDTLEWVTEVFFEESLEMVGATVILWGAWLLASHHDRATG